MNQWIHSPESHLRSTNKLKNNVKRNEAKKVKKKRAHSHMEKRNIEGTAKTYK